MYFLPSDSVDSLGALPSEDAGSIENKLSVIVQYWKQGQNESTNHRPVSLSRTQARKLWRDVEKVCTYIASWLIILSSIIHMSALEGEPTLLSRRLITNVG